MTVEEARIIAHEKLVAVSKGIDPVAEDAKAAGLVTVAEICDWYTAEAEAGRILGRRRRAIKASTLAMDRSRIEAHIKPLLGRSADRIAEARGHRGGASRHRRGQKHRRRASAAGVAPPPAAKASRRARCRRCMPSSSTPCALDGSK